MHTTAVRKTRRILLIGSLVTVLGTISWLVLRPHDPEPTYNGKPLSYWLDGFSPPNRNPSPREFDADKAMQQIGTNALPTLLRLLKTRDSKFKINLIQFAQKQHLINLNWKTARFHQLQAWFGFRCLGTNGKSAVPALIEIYNQRPPDQDNDAHGYIPLIFAAMGPAAADAVPLLVQATTDTNHDIRWSAVSGLGRIRARPELAVPALTEALRDSDSHLQVDAAVSLAAFGTNAQSAVSGLITALSDANPDVRTNAAYALNQIDPEAAAQAGVK